MPTVESGGSQTGGLAQRGRHRDASTDSLAAPEQIRRAKSIPWRPPSTGLLEEEQMHPVTPRRRHSPGRDSVRLPYQGPAALVAGLPDTLRCQDRARAGSGGAGNPSHARGSCGHPEANVVVPVVRRVPVAVGRAAVRAAVAPRAAAAHAIRASGRTRRISHSTLGGSRIC